MNQLRAIIIEDEIPSARLLSSMLQRLRPGWDITVLSGNVEESVQWFSNHPHPDIIFLDIQLSDGNSFDFLSEARPSSAIIFTTAYDEYAIRAFGVNSIDYILKPFDEKRLLEALLKYETITRPIYKQEEYIDTILDCLHYRKKRYRTRFLISGVNSLWTLQVSDIAYFYSENKITFAVTRTCEEHIIDLPLNKLSEQLDPDKFFRANRQVLLCIDSITKVEPFFNGKIIVSVKPPHKNQILISEEKIPSFKLWLNF